MSIMKSVRNFFGYNTFDDAVKAWLEGSDVNRGVLAPVGNASLRYTAVFACCRVLAETFASVSLHEYQRRKDDGRDRTWDTGAYDVMGTAPNSEMDAHNLSEMMVYQLNLGGNFVAKVKRNSRGEPMELLPFEHQNVVIERNKNTGKIDYRISSGNIDTPLVTYNRPDAFHVVGLSANGLIGMSPISFAAQAIRLGMQYENFGNDYFANGIYPSGMFAKDKAFSPEGYKRFKAHVEESYIKRKGAPIIADDGMRYTPFQLNLADAQLIESKRFQVEDVNRVFRVPLHMVQELSRSTNNNIEHQSLEFVMYTMLPWFKRVERAINSQLLTRYDRSQGYYLEYNLASLLRGDQKSMADAFAVGRHWGWLSVNDVRRMMNLNPIPNGDRYLEPLNMVEAGQVAPTQGQISDDVKREIENIMKERGK